MRDLRESLICLLLSRLYFCQEHVWRKRTIFQKWFGSVSCTYSITFGIISRSASELLKTSILRLIWCFSAYNCRTIRPCCCSTEPWISSVLTTNVRRHCFLKPLSKVFSHFLKYARYSCCTNTLSDVDIVVLLELYHAVLLCLPLKHFHVLLFQLRVHHVFHNKTATSTAKSKNTFSSNSRLVSLIRTRRPHFLLTVSIHGKMPFWQCSCSISILEVEMRAHKFPRRSGSLLTRNCSHLLFSQIDGCVQFCELASNFRDGS